MGLHFPGNADHWSSQNTRSLLHSALGCQGLYLPLLSCHEGQQEKPKSIMEKLQNSLKEKLAKNLLEEPWIGEDINVLWRGINLKEVRGIFSGSMGLAGILVFPSVLYF